MSKPSKVICPDCGPTPAPHYLSWFTVVIDWLSKPYQKLMEKIWRRFKPLVNRLPWDRIAFRSIFVLQAVGLGKVVKNLQDDHSLRTRALWEEANRRGIELFEFRPFNRTVELLVARYNNQLYAFDGLPRARAKQSVNSGSEWMDDKMIMRHKFIACGLPVARGGTAVLVKKALQIFDQVGGPVIVKPRFGSRSRHTYLHIMSRSQLVTAFYSAQKLSPWVVIEQELRGAVHRATVINGKLIGVARRDYPLVVGDGNSTIGQLVEWANQNPLRRQSDIYTLLPGQGEVEAELARQGLSWDSVPAVNQTVYLANKVNRGLGGVTTEVTSQVHRDNIKLFEQVARVVNDQIIGIDFIIEAIDQPWHKQIACGIIECNSLPFIDLHHYPLAGVPRNVAGAIWDLIWPQTPAAATVVAGEPNKPDRPSYPDRTSV